MQNAKNDEKVKKSNSGKIIILIVSIIIMLLLAGVGIQLVMNSGLFDNEKDGSKNIEGKTYISIEKDIKEKLPEGAGKKVAENTEYIDKNGDTAIIPGGFTISGISSEVSINEGLVIYLIDDKTEEEISAIDWTDEDVVEELQTTYDQFVWIPIEDINDIYMCQSEDGTKSCKITVKEVNGEEVAYCTTHSSTQMAGRLYIKTDSLSEFDSSLTTQTYVAKTRHYWIREPDIVTGNDGTSCDNNYIRLGHLNELLETSFTNAKNFKTYLQEEYNEIVKSVYENGGFYVGRYETSNITETDGDAIEVVAGVIPSSEINWYYMYAQQVKYAENKNLSVGSTMIQGAAYDQVMKFVDTENYDVTTAKNVGHEMYDFITIPNKTGGRDYEINYIGTETYNDVSKNIYDLEGNVRLWTSACYSTTSRLCMGGTYSIKHEASSWGTDNPERFNLLDNGTLIQLYVK